MRFMSGKDVAVELIAKLRDAGFSRQDIARDATMSYSTVARLERGHSGQMFHATLRRLEKLVAAKTKDDDTVIRAERVTGDARSKTSPVG